MTTRRLLLSLAILMVVFSSYACVAQHSELVKSAWNQERPVSYDPSYVRLDYPSGDVDSTKGVCTDVIIRIYRGVGLDLQKAVHEDMSAHFSVYSAKKRFGQTTPDKNIDHRRVPNLVTYFERFGLSLSIDPDSDSWQPGDIVTWKLGGNLDHIGMLVDERGESGNWKVIHNIGGGQVVEDFLLGADIVGHYRLSPKP